MIGRVIRRSQYSSLIGPGPECGGYGEDALCVIQTTLADPCPDIKKLAAQLVMTLATRAENRKMLRLRGQKIIFKLHKILLLPCAVVQETASPPRWLATSATARPQSAQSPWPRSASSASPPRAASSRTW